MRGESKSAKVKKERIGVKKINTTASKQAVSKQRNAGYSEDLEAGCNANLSIKPGSNTEYENALQNATWSNKNHEFQKVTGELYLNAAHVKKKVFDFEKIGKKYVGYNLKKNKYQVKDKVDIAFDNSIIRARLVAISTTLDDYARRKIGSSSMYGYTIYGVGLLALYLANISSSVIEGERCRIDNFTAEQVQAECAKGNFTAHVGDCFSDSQALLIYITSNFALFNVALWSERIGTFWVTSAKSTSKLYSRLQETKCNVVAMHYIGDKNGILDKKLQFIQYIRLKFWEELMLIKGYTSPSKFFYYCNSYEISVIDANVLLGLSQYFVEVARELNNDAELVQLITGLHGQILAESIVDTLTGICKHNMEKKWYFWNKFTSFIKPKDITYLVDSVLGTNLLIKEGHFAKNAIKFAEMFNSSDSSDGDNLLKKSSSSTTDDKKASSSEEDASAEVAFTHLIKRQNQRHFLESQSDTQAKPNRVRFAADSEGQKKSAKSSNAHSNKSSSEAMNSKLRKFKSLSEIGDELSASKSISQDDIAHQAFFSPTLVNRFIDCIKKTIHKKNLPQETIDYIFATSLNFIPDLKDIKKVQDDVAKKLLSRDIAGKTRYLVLGGYIMLQSTFLSFTAIQDSSFISWWHVFVALQAVSMLLSIGFEFPKRAMEKSRKCWMNNLDNFESAIRTLLSADLIRIDQNTSTLKPSLTVRNMQLITICTVHMLCKSKNKEVAQFSKNDLIYLTTYIINVFVKFYKNESKHNFEIKDPVQMRVIIQKLCKNLEPYYGCGAANLMHARFPGRISVQKGVPSKLIYDIIKESIYVTANSPDIINISNTLMLNFDIKQGDKFSVNHAFIHVCAYRIRDFKLACRIDRLSDEQQKRIAKHIWRYIERNNDIVNPDLKSFDDNLIKRKIQRVCERVVGIKESDFKGAIIENDSTSIDNAVLGFAGMGMSK